jgi:hypothetical protein
MGWNAVGAAVISGLQGRYFIPVVMLGLLSIYGIRLTRQRTLVAMLLVVADDDPSPYEVLLLSPRRFSPSCPRHSSQRKHPPFH